MDIRFILIGGVMMIPGLAAVVAALALIGSGSGSSDPTPAGARPAATATAPAAPPPAPPAPPPQPPSPDEIAADADRYREWQVHVGEWVFQQRCVACHGAHGEGLVGPNLTDHYHLYDHSRRDLLEIIREGRPERGMPAWGEELESSQIYALTRYVWSIRHQDLPGRAPEGEAVEATAQVH